MVAGVIAIIGLIALGLVMLAVAYAIIARATICHRPRDLSHDRIAALGDSHNPSNPFHASGDRP